jgi:hypothetical protein
MDFETAEPERLKRISNGEGGFHVPSECGRSRGTG